MWNILDREDLNLELRDLIIRKYCEILKTTDLRKNSLESAV